MENNFTQYQQLDHYQKYNFVLGNNVKHHFFSLPGKPIEHCLHEGQYVLELSTKSTKIVEDKKLKSLYLNYIEDLSKIKHIINIWKSVTYLHEL
jgi:hypothetical protein